MTAEEFRAILQIQIKLIQSAPPDVECIGNPIQNNRVQHEIRNACVAGFLRWKPDEYGCTSLSCPAEGSSRLASMDYYRPGGAITIWRRGTITITVFDKDRHALNLGCRTIGRYLAGIEVHDWLIVS